ALAARLVVLFSGWQTMPFAAAPPPPLVPPVVVLPPVPVVPVPPVPVPFAACVVQAPSPPRRTSAAKIFPVRRLVVIEVLPSLSQISSPTFTVDAPVARTIWSSLRSSCRSSCRSSLPGSPVPDSGAVERQPVDPEVLGRLLGEPEGHVVDRRGHDRRSGRRPRAEQPVRRTHQVGLPLLAKPREGNRVEAPVVGHLDHHPVLVSTGVRRHRRRQGARRDGRPGHRVINGRRCVRPP